MVDKLFYSDYRKWCKIKGHKYYLEHRVERDKYQKHYRDSEYGKEVRMNNILNYSKKLKYEYIDIIPQSTWQYIGFNKLDFHHINDILITVLPEKIHDKRLGKEHRKLINNWYKSIYINLDEILYG